MINNVNNVGGVGKPMGPAPGAQSPGAAESGSTNGPSFADALAKSIDEVSKLQQDASAAVEALATGKTDDVAKVTTAVEKSDLAFKTLLAIRAKLMDAYEELKSVQV